MAVLGCTVRGVCSRHALCELLQWQHSLPFSGKETRAKQARTSSRWSLLCPDRSSQNKSTSPAEGKGTGIEQECDSDPVTQTARRGERGRGRGRTWRKSLLRMTVIIAIIPASACGHRQLSLCAPVLFFVSPPTPCLSLSPSSLLWEGCEQPPLHLYLFVSW